MLVITVNEGELVEISHGGEVLRLKLDVKQYLAKRRARICIDGPRAFAVRRIYGDLTSATRERGSDGPPIDRKPAPTPAPPPPTRRQP